MIKIKAFYYYISIFYISIVNLEVGDLLRLYDPKTTYMCGMSMRRRDQFIPKGQKH